MLTGTEFSIKAGDGLVRTLSSIISSVSSSVYDIAMFTIHMRSKRVEIFVSLETVADLANEYWLGQTQPENFWNLELYLDVSHENNTINNL